MVLTFGHQSLLAPVLQHLMHGVARRIASLHGYAVLQRLFKAERRVQTFEDRVVLATLHTLRSSLSAIVLRRERSLYALTEEMEGILNLIVSQNVKGGEERRLLLLHDHLLPQPRLLLQPRLGTSHAVTVNQLSSHTAEHQAGHHAHGGGADAESLARLHLVVVLHRLQAHLLKPQPALGLKLR